MGQEGWPGGGRWLASPRVRVALAFVGLLAAFFGDVVFFGRTLQVSRTISTVFPDGPAQQVGPAPSAIPIIDNSPAVVEEPFLAFKRQQLATGRFPLWNPHQAAGMPFAANPDSTLFSPLELPLYLLPQRFAWDAFLLLRLFIAGYGGYLLLELLGCAPLAAFGGGVAFMLSGPVITWLNNFTLNSDCLMPLLLWALERLLRGESASALPAAAAVIGCSILGGHPEHAFFTNAIGATYLVFRIVTGPPSLRAHPTVVRAASAYLLGIGLAAVFLLPFAEYLFGAGWIYHSAESGTASDEVGARAITILMPYLFQRELVRLTYEHAGWLGGYLGAASLLLALLGIRHAAPSRVGAFFGAVLVLALAKCYAVPGVNFLGVLPGLGYLRFSLHLTTLIGFVTAMLVGLACDRIYRGADLGSEALWGALALVFVAIGFLFYHGPALAPLRVAAAVAPLLVACAAIPALLQARALTPALKTMLVLSVLVGELFVHHPTDHPQRYNAAADTPYLRWLQGQPQPERVFGTDWMLFPNTASAFGVDDLGIYGGIFVARFVEFIRTLVDPRRFSQHTMVGELRTRLPDYTNPFLDLLNLRYLVAPCDAPRPPNTVLAYQADACIYRRASALPRAYLVARWEPVGTMSEALAKLAAGFDFRTSALVEDGGALPASDAAAPLDLGSGASIESYTPDLVRIRATAPHPAILVLADTYYPGWTATVDGEAASVLPTNALVRGVFLRPGTHLVEFRFQPRSVLIGATLSAATLAALIVLSLAAMLR